MSKAFISKSWNKYLNLIQNNKKDIYFQEEYFNLYETENDFSEAFIYTLNEKVFLFPYLKRKIIFENKNIYDFETPYGYGGFISNTNDYNFLIDAQKTFFETMIMENFICGFIRFHPLIKNHTLLNSNDTFEDRKTITIDLKKTIEQILYEQISQKQRNSINKALNSNLMFFIDEKFEHINDFKKLYHENMDRLSADKFYYFNDDYFENLSKIKNTFISCIKYNNEIISSAIFFDNTFFSNYHLSATNQKYKGLNPNSFLLYKTILFLKEKGVTFLNLGGGYNNNEDNSLFLYKKSFSKDIDSFFIGKIVFDKITYSQICKNWEENNIDKINKYNNILLKYRY